MPLHMKQKQAIVSALKKIAHNALSAVIADPRGVNVNDMTELRKAGRNASVYMRVVRNTIMRRVVDGTSFECLKDTFFGPTLIAFSTAHPGAAARIFNKFAKKNATFKIKTAAFEGKVLEGLQIDSLASLPTEKEAIARLISAITEASAGKLVRTLVAFRDHTSTR